MLGPLRCFTPSIWIGSCVILGPDRLVGRRCGMLRPRPAILQRLPGRPCEGFLSRRQPGGLSLPRPMISETPAPGTPAAPAVPASRAGVEGMLQRGEAVQAVAETDLDERLHFASGVVALTD